jgi:hypothetical protein
MQVHLPDTVQKANLQEQELIGEKGDELQKAQGSF